MKNYVLSYSAIFFIFLLWLVLYEVISHPLIMPHPWQVVESFFALFITQTHLSAMLHSLLRLVVAVGSALVIGIFIGLLAGLNPNVSLVIRPYVTILRTIPVISIIIILVILVGYRIAPYVITFMMVFPIVYQAVHEGVLAMDPSLIDIYRIEGRNHRFAIKNLYLPLLEGHLVLASLQSFGLGIKVLIMSEFIAQTQPSIGHAMYVAKTFLNYQDVFAWTLLLIIITLLIESQIRRFQKKQQNK